ncbi:MAG: 3-oxoacyl-[acyl-carrier-protein] reductase [Dehalococcoidia bacterium]
MLDLSNRVAIVTGSSRGIGRAVALKLAERGAAVVVNGLRDQSSVDRVVAEIQAGQGRAVGILADVSSAQDIPRLVEAATSQFGRIDILVNNAGIVRDELLVRMKEEDWDQVLSTNLRAAFLCIRAVLRYMIRQRWGRIINITSVAGLIGNAGQANYASAKAGLIGLTKTIAREVASRGITANAIAPGFIDTDMTQRLGEELRGGLVKQIPLGYIGSTEDVAQAAVFLASEEAKYITGQVLNVDGGLVMGG